MELSYAVRIMADRHQRLAADEGEDMVSSQPRVIGVSQADSTGFPLRGTGR